ncbi:MAG: hypothetical protein Q8M44_02365 [bacterium]|nr:hypothetical protein [bacterium]
MFQVYFSIVLGVPYSITSMKSLILGKYFSCLVINNSVFSFFFCLYSSIFRLSH